MTARTLTIFLLATAVALLATVSVTPQTQLLVITGASVVDVVDGRIIPNRTVTINGGTIVSVTQDTARPANTRVVNGQGKYLIPGLWDMHAHIEMTGESWLQL